MYNYCKTCCHDDGDIGFCDKCFYNHILEEKGIPPTEYEAKPKPKTNADRIRSMTEEELANALAHKADACRNCSSDSLDICKDCWLEWLEQEAEARVRRNTNTITSKLTCRV